MCGGWWRGKPQSRMDRPIELDTERLRLRQWTEADRWPFAQLNADPRVMEFFPAPLTRAESDSLADRCEALIAERGWGLWAAETKAECEFVGFVGLHVPMTALPFCPCVEIGWRLAVPFWGRGLATEAAHAVLDLGFAELGLDEIVSYTSILNRRSRAVMERLGMVKSVATFEHPSVPEGHPLREHCLYRLARAQYEASRLRTRLVRSEKLRDTR
jgi:RimJ/RimL family protein N-acetyltransferase